MNRREAARIAAPVAFLAGVTLAVGSANGSRPAKIAASSTITIHAALRTTATEDLRRGLRATGAGTTATAAAVPGSAAD